MSVRENISEQGMGDLGVERRYHFISFGLLIISLIANIHIEEWGFPGCSKEPAFQHRRHMRCGFDPWAGKIPWRRACQPTPVFLPGESHGQSSLAV